MKTFPFHLAPLFCCLSLLLPVGCDDPSAPELDEARKAELVKLTENVVAANVPGVVLLVRRGEQVTRIARGVSDKTTGQPLHPSDRFRIGSLTKTYVATVMLQLVDEGKLALTDTIGSRLPDLVSRNGQATVQQLLRNESGLYDYLDDQRVLAPYLAGDLGFAWRPEQLVAIAMEHEPRFAPGTQYHYSNTNYVLLALLAERVTGKDMARFIAERITGPLGVRATSVDLEPQMVAPYSHGYFRDSGGERDLTGMSPSWAWGAGNMVADAADVATFFRAVVAGRFVSKPLLEAMFTASPHSVQDHYGMGIARVDVDCGRFMGHGGGFLGYKTLVFQSLDDQREVVLFQNLFSGDDGKGDEAAAEAVNKLLAAAACS
jgi:D-alanyl-D-alanine carboxypeptidase